MRIRNIPLLILLTLCLACLLSAAKADSIVYGDTTYVFPEGEPQEPASAALTLSVQYASVDPHTFEKTQEPPHAGAVFGVYAKGAEGAFTPYPDPSDPLRPWMIRVDEQPIAVSMPLSVDLYIRQEIAADGFLPGDDGDAYRLLRLPESITYSNYAQGMQGLQIRLSGKGPSGTVPLSDVRFTLEGMGTSHSLVTDSGGIITLLGIAAGDYILKQETTPQGYFPDEAEIPVTVKENRAIQLSVTNSRAGTIALYPTGITVDASLQEISVPLKERVYEILREDGTSAALLTHGQAIMFPASLQGTVYLVREKETANDGFPANPIEHTVVLHSGETIAQEPTVRSDRGLFSLSVLSDADDSPVGGAIFTLYNESDIAQLTFKSEDDGVYLPNAPLSPGVYTLRMASAPKGFLYIDEPIRFQIRPYLTDDRPITEITFPMIPVPESLSNPAVLATVQNMPSLFEENIQLDFQLSLENTNELKLPISDLSFDIVIPVDPSIRLMREFPDGARIDIARRLPLPGVTEMRELSISGTVRYVFTYLSAPNTLTDVNVSAPFTVLVATFDAMQNPPDFALYGYVKDASGKPISGMRVSYEDPSGALAFAETLTDPYGAYAFEEKAIKKAASDAVIRFYPEKGYGALVDAGNATILPLETRTGRFILHDIASFEGISVSLGSMPAQKPDTDGRFTFTGVFADEDRVSVELPNGITARIEETLDETLVNLYPSASIAGTLHDMDNDIALPGIEITLTGGGETLTAQTDAKGAFLFDDLLAGSYTLTIVDSGAYRLSDEKKITAILTSGEAKQLPAINMKRPAALEGRVCTAEGEALPGVPVTLAEASRTVTTDSQGRFAFDSLAFGDYTLDVKLPEGVVLSSPPQTVSLKKSGDHAHVTLSVVKPAHVSGRIWNDTNDDGVLASGEPGLPSVDIALLSANSDTELARTSTDSQGDFLFEDLVPGNYRIQVTLPRGMIFAKGAPGAAQLIAGLNESEGYSEIFSLSQGQDLSGLACGATASGIVSGIIWDDHNGDGLYDENEPLIPGVQVTLLQNDAPISTQQTDDLGFYQFAGLRMGDYSLRVELPEGSLFTKQATGTAQPGSTFSAMDNNVGDLDFTVKPLRAEAIINAGALRATAIKARVWLDANGDGDAWNEQGYDQGMQLELYSISESGSGMLVASKVTDADGRASFTELRPGSYRVHYKLPEESWGFTAGGLSLVGMWGQGPVATIGELGETEVDPVGVARLGSIAGTVFADAEYDGLRSETDKGLADTTVYLLDESENIVQTKQTESDGAYSFIGVPPGTYSVRFELPQGFTFTMNRDDAPSFSSDVTETPGNIGDSSPVYLPMGERMLINAGAYKAGSISGMVWHDAKGNGIFMNSNRALSGIQVELLREDSVCLTVLTAEDGTYLFDSLPPGTYTVRITLPEGMFFTDKHPPAGRGNTILPTQGNVGRTSPIPLLMNAHEKNIDAGIVYTGSVTGMAIDVQSESEEGVEGVIVRLVRNNEPDVEAVTGKDGSFSIEGVRAGDGALHIEAPEGWLLNANQKDILEITIPQNDVLDVSTLRLLHETIIQGHLWLDTNQNRVWDEGETPVVGAVVALLSFDDDVPAVEPKSVNEAQGEAPEENPQSEDGFSEMEAPEDEEEETNNIIAITGSDENGKFYFDRLQAGNYSIRIIPPAGIMLYSGAQSPIAHLPVGETVDFIAPAYVASYIRGTVWEDDNSDGLYSSDERLLEGIPVQLLDLEGNVLLEQLTDNDGNYLFNELPPITCVVRINLLEGYVFSQAAEGGSTIVQSNGSREGTTAPITLAMGDRVNNMSAGCMRTGSIGNTVWMDETGNGLLDSTDPALEGVQITLWRVSNDGTMAFIAETKSDAFGHYRFEAMRPGYYQLSFTTGEGYLPTRPFDGLDEINSKLPWIARQSVSTDVFLLRSGEEKMNMHAGFVTSEIAEALGWSIGNDGSISVP